VKRFACVDDQKAAGFPVTAACEAAAATAGKAAADSGNRDLLYGAVVGIDQACATVGL
jgi:hypothetical protein